MDLAAGLASSSALEMPSSARCLLLLALLVVVASSTPGAISNQVLMRILVSPETRLLLPPLVLSRAELHHESEGEHPAPLAELGSRVASHVTALPDPRLGLPSVADIEAIKKVAQILVMLGEQVIPTIIGQPSAASGEGFIVDSPNDSVVH